MTAPEPTTCEACGQDSDFQRRQAIKIRALEAERDGLKHLLAEAVENLRLEMLDKPQDSTGLIRRAERALWWKA